MEPSDGGDGDGEVAAKQIQSPPSRSMGSSGGGGGAEVATKLPELTLDASDGAGSEDRLSALPNDVLVLILGRFNTRAAAQTSVLSRRWRRVWALLPELNFYSVAAWLPVAARRVSGHLSFLNLARESNAQERGAFELPCLERATNASLNLGFLGLAVPPAIRLCIILSAKWSSPICAACSSSTLWQRLFGTCWFHIVSVTIGANQLPASQRLSWQHLGGSIHMIQLLSILAT